MKKMLCLLLCLACLAPAGALALEEKDVLGSYDLTDAQLFGAPVDLADYGLHLEVCEGGTAQATWTRQGVTTQENLSWHLDGDCLCVGDWRFSMTGNGFTCNDGHTTLCISHCQNASAHHNGGHHVEPARKSSTHHNDTHHAEPTRKPVTRRNNNHHGSGHHGGHH